MSSSEDEESLIEEVSEESASESSVVGEEEEEEGISGFSINGLEFMLERVEEWYKLIKGTEGLPQQTIGSEKTSKVIQRGRRRKGSTST